MKLKKIYLQIHKWEPGNCGIFPLVIDLTYMRLRHKLILLTR